MNRILCVAAILLVALALIGFAGCSKNNAIHDAARNGDLEKVKALLKDILIWFPAKTPTA